MAVDREILQAKMARFRNLIVHRYGEVDRERVWRILTERREDIIAFFDVLFDRYKS